LPSVQRTYSKRGCTPRLDAAIVTSKVVRAAVAISPQGDLFCEVRECNFGSPAVTRFLTNLQRQWRKKLLVIWDGASIHTCNHVKQWLTNQKENRIWLARFPPYSPELNPAEQVWNYLKNVLLRNICCKTVKELKQKVIEAFEILKKDRQLIQLFFCHKNTAFYD